MSAGPHPLRWVPALSVGLCTATAAEVAVALLLYNGPGFMRSLTAVLAIEAASLGLGVWAVQTGRGDPHEALRRRWLFCLGTFLLASVFTASWSFIEVLGGTALGQGLGLAVMAALPLYAAGGVLGAMAHAERSEGGGGVGSVGGPALIGASVGFAATGAALPQVLTPASLFLVCLVLLSAGGMVYGSVLDTRVRVLVRGRAPGRLGEVRVEDRLAVSSGGVLRLLLEGDHLRRWSSLGGEAAEPWEVVAFLFLLEPGRDDAAVLLVGGGASALPRRALPERPELRVTVAERSPEVAELGREYLEGGLPPGVDGRGSLEVGNLEDILRHVAGPFALVAVDTAGLAPQGGVSSLSSSAREALLRSVGVGGYLAFGPHLPGSDEWTFPEGWSVARYTRSVALDGVWGDVPERECILLGAPAGTVLPSALGPFSRLDEGDR